MRKRERSGDKTSHRARERSKAATFAWMWLGVAGRLIKAGVALPAWPGYTRRDCLEVPLWAKHHPAQPPLERHTSANQHGQSTRIWNTTGVPQPVLKVMCGSHAVGVVVL